MRKALLLALALAAPAAARELEPLPVRPAEAETELVRLGRRLFFDRRLSRDGRQSCASCHRPELAFTDGLPRAENSRGKDLARNTMTVLNSGSVKALFWDGRAASLEEQALHPLGNPEEMNMSAVDLVAALARRPSYRRQFAEVFGAEGVTTRGVARALAAYQRTLRSTEAPLDRHLRGDAAALGPEARRGLALFAGKAGCVRCHGGPLLTDGKFHRTGVPGVPSWPEDPGRRAVDGRAESEGKFRTPSLRELTRTAPYMHNGVFRDLRQVLDFYDRREGKDLDPLLRPLGLSATEKADLEAFLGTLNSAAADAGPRASGY